MSAEILNFPTKDGWQRALSMKNKSNWLLLCYEGKYFEIRHCHNSQYKEGYRDWAINERQARTLYENRIKAAMFVDGRPYAVRRIAQATWEDFLKLCEHKKNINRF